MERELPDSRWKGIVPFLRSHHNTLSQSKPHRKLGILKFILKKTFIVYTLVAKVLENEAFHCAKGIFKSDQSSPVRGFRLQFSRLLSTLDP
eukprot:scaffold11007_cov76-Amphora_coffeaeformis.AAC.1